MIATVGRQNEKNYPSDTQTSGKGKPKAPAFYRNLLPNHTLPV